MARGREARAAEPETGRPASARSTLLADLARRQPLLAAINVGAALLFAAGIVGAAPAPAVAAWLICATLLQLVRLAYWRRHARGRPPRDPAGWLVATSAATGIGWGLIGLLFADLGSPAQQLLVPFFLAGMAAGAVPTLAGHPPALCAFLVPALLPYAARLALAGEPVAPTMAFTVIAYAAGLAAVACQVHRSLRRSVDLHLENARLVADLEQARAGLERLAERRAAELNAVLEAVPMAVWLAHDPEAKRITGNCRAAALLRPRRPGNQSLTAADDGPPRHFRFLKEGEQLPAEELPLRRAARGEAVQEEELRLQFDDGTFLDQLVSAAPVRDAAGRIVGAVGAAVDITARKAAESRIEHLALHDALTGLPNRALLLDRLGHTLERARRAGIGAAIIALDLDGFKDVNDSFGHDAGDRLLRAVAERIAGLIRGSDTLARVGGDEFALVQGDIRGPEAAVSLARKVLTSLVVPFDLHGQEVHASASLGIALFPGDGHGPADLLRSADLALYRAKQEGRRRYQLFNRAMDAEAQTRRRVERELRSALERGELSLYYQPQLDLETDRFTAVEALVRWHHPKRGLVLPGEFVPVAEASGLIHHLGAWVLREACCQAQAWREHGLTLAMGVNVSPAQLRHPDGLGAVDEALRVSGLDPRLLELEITEGLLVELSGGTIGDQLAALANRGVQIAIDDFGTGYSSLAYLKRLPVQRIKIDRSFVRGIGTDPEDEAVVQAIVGLGHALGKKVVAEGVESAAQLAFLRQLGCDAAQGFARPATRSGGNPGLIAA